MKTLIYYINEALKIGKNLSKFSTYSCQPKTKEELEQIIKDRISKEGTNCDLNDIDTSLIEDMSYLFWQSEFNGDISKWNVSKVENMNGTFYKSKFNGDISNWDVSKVKDMSYAFALSSFNRDISNWNISKDCDVRSMFYSCPIKEEHKPKSLRCSI